MSIRLQRITRDNWQDALQLQVHPEQEKYVASNLYSMAQAHAEPEWTCRGIYDGETMVGFIMDGVSEEGDTLDGYWVRRFMLGKQYQKMGYGRRAMDLLLQEVRDQGHSEVFISFVPENEGAKRLYTSVGFVDTGAMDDDEVVYRLAWNGTDKSQ